MTKTIIQLAIEARLYDDDQEPLVQHLERFSALHRAAILEELTGAELPEPVAQLHPAHLKPNPDGSEWCREVLLYSPNNEGDKLRGVNTRVKLYTAEQMREYAARQVAKRDAEIAAWESKWSAIEEASTRQFQRVVKLVADRDAARAENLGYAKALLDLEAEVKRLTALVASTATTYDDALAAAQERNAQLRTEVERLREALTRIKLDTHDDTAEKVARKALEQK